MLAAGRWVSKTGESIGLPWIFGFALLGSGGAALLVPDLHRGIGGGARAIGVHPGGGRTILMLHMSHD